MPDDGDLRVGPWRPDSPAGAEPPTTPPESDPETRQWWEDMPDPWDRLPNSANADGNDSDEPATGELPQIRRSRWSRRDTALRRGALIVVLVGVVLVGTGALVNMFTPEPSAFPAPPTPPGPPASSPPAVDSRLGGAPTGPPSESPIGPGAPGGTAQPGEADPVPVSPGAPTTGPPPPASDSQATVTVSLEAEDAQLGGLASSYSAEEASGGEAVQAIGMWGLNFVRFPEITVPSAGEYVLTFDYLSNRDRTGRYSVNDGPAVSVDFPGLGDGDSVGSVTVTVELAEGENTIWFGGGGIAGPDLDRITVTG